LNQLYTDILTSMDWPERPELFVSQTPFAQRRAFGMDRPFIVINSGTLKLLDDDEVRNVLGHELGHVMSGHALYHTISCSSSTWPGRAPLPRRHRHPADPARPARVVPQERALVDRAGLLACQDPTASLRVNLKFAGGGRHVADGLERVPRAGEGVRGGGRRARPHLQDPRRTGRSHPFNTVRAAELQRWIEGGTTIAWLRGEYTRAGPKRSSVPSTRTSTTPRPLHEGSEGRRERRGGYRQAAAQAFTDAFNKKK